MRAEINAIQSRKRSIELIEFERLALTLVLYHAAETREFCFLTLCRTPAAALCDSPHQSSPSKEQYPIKWKTKREIERQRHCM